MDLSAACSGRNCTGTVSYTHLIAIYSLEPHYFDDDLCRKCLMKHFGVNSLSGLGVEEFPNGVIAAGSLLSYLYDTQKIPLSHFTHIEPYLVNRYMPVSYTHLFR